MMPHDPGYAELCETLRNEAREQIERMGSALMELEGGVAGSERASVLEEAFRQAHNLKGAAGSLGFRLTARLAHAVESALDALKASDAADPAAMFDALHSGLTALEAALAADPDAESEPKVAAAVEQLSTLVRKATAAVSSSSALTNERELPPSSSDPQKLQPQPDGATQARRGVPRAVTATKLGAGIVIEPPSVVAQLPSNTEASVVDTPRAAESSRGKVRSGSAGRAGDETMRVSTKKLSALMAQVGELLAARMRTDQRLAELRTVLAGEEERLNRRSALRAMVRDEVPAKLDRFAQRLVDAQLDGLEHQKLLVRRLREITRAFAADTLQSTILSGELQEDIRRIQTFPLSSVLDPLPRAVRNMAREAGKLADLVVEGAEIELDKKVLEELRDPLNHLLRNAIDHGVESPQQRAALGKPPRATIRIRAEHRGDAILISVTDDGPGVDLDAVRRAAVACGSISAAEAEELADPQVLELLFTPGLTTRSVASGLSGRGIGLDAVRTNVDKLHGSVTIESRAEHGTTLGIVLPLTVYVVHSLVVRVNEQCFALPISSIQRILRIGPADVLDVEGTSAIVVEGRPVALVDLAAVLGMAPDQARDAAPTRRQVPGADRVPVLVIGSGATRCALAVDEIVGDETLLAKNLEPPLVRVRNIGGATILGDGTIVLMLNPVDLMRTASTHGSARSNGSSLAAAVARPPKLLLADDSFTTRALERSVLELAGFEVVAVADGQEALSALEQGDFDVVVSDVSMPNLTGLELCARIRSSDRLRRLPVVLVTSLASDDDKRRGMEVGADSYIVKSEFDHHQLVAIVNGLVGRT
jgi:two-component system chemotaxis sensor kinase CheA